MALTLLIIITFTMLARLWYRIDFKYGAEWLVRLPSARHGTTAATDSEKQKHR